MAIAILVSEKIFNFSELVATWLLLARAKGVPISERQRQLQLAIHSDGNLQFWQCHQVPERHAAVRCSYWQPGRQSWPAQPAIANRKKTLEDKIKIMAFSELVFTLPKNERTVTFEQISSITGIPLKLIELMIIKAMALDLLKGSIDEVIRV